jgi:ribonuclease-3
MSRKPKRNNVANSSPASNSSRSLPDPLPPVANGDDGIPVALVTLESKKTPRRRRKTPPGFEERIGYKFKDTALLEQALTHISALAGPRNRASSYQRLEFLGDHVLGLVISDMLYGAFPKADEGELSRRLADLVRKEACADVAKEIELGAAIRLGASENNAGGRNRTAILADVCEALIGAVFIDGGYKAASEVINRLWEQRMRVPARPLRDSKTILQEWAQARGLPTPAYREVERKGPDHNPEFRVTVELPNRAPAEGIGRSKRGAEQAAAAAMLTREGVNAERLDG